MLNNPLALLSSSYDSYINRVEFLDILQDGGISLTIQDIVEELQKSGYVFTDYEKEMFAKMEVLEADKDQQPKYTDEENEKLRDFSTKYRAEIMKIQEKEKDINATTIENHFKESGIELTDDEKKILELIKKNENSEYALKQKEFYKVYGDSINNFIKLFLFQSIF